MAAKERRIPDHVLAMLEEMEADGEHLRMHPRKLERSDYQDMNKVVAALGGKWKGGKVSAHVFPPGTNVASLIDMVMATGRYEDPKDSDFVETPVVLAEDLVERARVGSGSRVLEPSAGLGRIALAARVAGADVTCIELSGSRCAKLRELKFNVTELDFMRVEPAIFIPFDAVIANPPFSKQQDIRHVRHMAKFVRPGGRIVSVMGAGVLFRTTNITKEFRTWVDSVDGEIEELPEGTFKAEGTMARAVVVTIVVP
jgi:predicted RNA methylase